MRAFGYIRLSKEDRQSTSPARQRQRIERLCEDREWELVEVFEDIDVSAFTGRRRPAFIRMMERLAETDALVFWRLDRLSRSVLEFSRILDQTQAAGVQLVSTDQPIDTSSAMGTAFVQISSVFAQLEAATLSERSRQMHAYKRERGEPTGRAPFGWRWEETGLVPDAEQQALLAEAARRFAGGDTFRGIALDLGFSAAGPLSRMLHSERVLQALPEDLAGELVAALRARRWERVPMSRMSFLGGIARCGECGASMSASSTRAGRRGRWFSYGCRTSGHVHISALWLDDHVSSRVVEAIDAGKVLTAIRRRERAASPRKVAELEARLELLEHDHYVKGDIPEARFRALRAALVDQLAAMEEAQRDLTLALPAALARDLAARWSSLTNSEQRQVVSAVVEAVEVQKARGNGPVDPSRVEILWRG